ncbi:MULTISPECIES: gp53-like domain-containing protein [unclassified Paraburkholderia]|uniref:gp53-like domain-containing protein n=1 Tax=unclassified Paraburkholderia TaxID=2615204 RepID=UPI002AB23D73|nr:MULTISPECIES: hypothetical protein [unclassified Paraburkholderia]
MTYLTESAEWAEGVRQFETSDPVEGGPDGVDNIPLKQLTNRTVYLKAAVEKTQSDLTNATRAATENVQGTAKAATQAQVDAGADDATFVTPKKLGAWSKPATETVAGLSKVSTQAIVDAGTDDTTFVTPKKLAAWAKQATETVFGLAKVATQTQTNAGTDDATFVTPKKLRAGFAIQLGVTGYLAFPTWLGGLILQWGVLSDQSWVANTFRTISFPLSFPTSVFQHVATMSNSAGSTGYVNTNGVSNSQFQVLVSYSGACTVRWIAVGY